MPKKRLLVVDDEEKIRALMKACLEPEYEVLLAPDGPTGVQMAKALQPDGLLLDIGLPELDGFNVLKVLKMSAETVRIPVIIISGRGESEALLDTEALGACDYLIKPVRFEEVRTTVRRYV